MLNQPLISVILTVYNEEEYIRESIESVLSQTWPNIQLIIVDDGSTDRTPEILRTEYQTDPRIETVFLPKNSHIAHATNAAMEHVRGGFTAIMDAADLWLPDKLEKQMDYLSAHPEFAGCFTWADIIDETGADANAVFPWYKEIFECHTGTREEWLRYFFYHGNRLNNPSSLITTESMLRTGKHHPFYIQGQDMQWWIRFTKKYAFGVMEEPLVKLRRKKEDSTRVSSSSESNATRFYNECMFMRFHFFDDMDDDLFIRTFGNDFVCADSRSETELECEKALLLCRPLNDSHAFCAPGLLQLEKLMADEKTAALLKEKYGYATAQIGKMTGTHVFSDARLQYYENQFPFLQEMHKVAEERFYLIKEEEKILEARKNEIDRLSSLLSSSEQKLSGIKEALLEIDRAPMHRKKAAIRQALDLLQ